MILFEVADRARSFYKHLTPEFEQNPTDELHLIQLLKDIKRTLPA